MRAAVAIGALGFTMEKFEPLFFEGGKAVEGEGSVGNSPRIPKFIHRLSKSLVGWRVTGDHATQEM